MPGTPLKRSSRFTTPTNPSDECLHGQSCSGARAAKPMCQRRCRSRRSFRDRVQTSPAAHCNDLQVSSSLQLHRNPLKMSLIIAIQLYPLRPGECRAFCREITAGSLCSSCLYGEAGRSRWTGRFCTHHGMAPHGNEQPQGDSPSCQRARASEAVAGCRSHSQPAACAAAGAGLFSPPGAWRGALTRPAAGAGGCAAADAGRPRYCRQPAGGG